MMKIITIILQAIFLGVVVVSVNAEEISWKYNDWRVDRILDSKMVRYVASGNTVYGHQFGFIKNVKDCSSDLLWISWSSYEKDLEDLVGTNAIFQFKVGDTSFQLEMSLVAVSELNSLITIVSFTKFVAGEELISLLEEGLLIQATIVLPKELAGKFDISTDTFSLNGFNAARHKTSEVCNGTN